MVGECLDGACGMSDGVSLREFLEGELREIRASIDRLVERVGVQNGRVTKLELEVEAARVRGEERERARVEAGRVAEETAKRTATLVSVVISLVGVLVSVVALWARGQ